MNKIAFVFPGQGSQYIGMGKKFYDMHSSVKETFTEANNILGFDLKEIIFNGDETELKKTSCAQPAILTLSVALFRLYQCEIGIKPFISAGHSLGEISALCCAGAIRFQDALSIVYRRGKLMQEISEKTGGGMIAVTGIFYEEVVETCEFSKNIFIANYNSNEEIILAGKKEDFSKVMPILMDKGAKVIPLQVSGPFHTPFMYPAALKFYGELMNFQYQEFNWPVISNINALPYLNKNDIAYNLTRQIYSPVMWKQTMEMIINQQVDTIIEAGPKFVLKKLFKRYDRSLSVFSMDDDKDYYEIKQLNQANESNRILIVLDKCIVKAVSVPNSNFLDDRHYVKKFSDYFGKLLELRESLKTNRQNPDLNGIDQALRILKNILEIKKISITVQNNLINQIMEETGLTNKAAVL